MDADIYSLKKPDRSAYIHNCIRREIALDLSLRIIVKVLLRVHRMVEIKSIASSLFFLSSVMGTTALRSDCLPLHCYPAGLLPLLPIGRETRSRTGRPTESIAEKRKSEATH